MNRVAKPHESPERAIGDCSALELIAAQMRFRIARVATSTGVLSRTQFQENVDEARELVARLERFAQEWRP